MVLVVAQVFQPSLPPVRPAQRPPAWDNPALDKRIGAVFRRACVDCHSNETRWPWYARVSPASWLLIRDVTRGRRQFNLSHQWNFADDERNEVAEAVHNRSMPPRMYLWLHPEAELTEEERKLFDSWADSE